MRSSACSRSRANGVVEAAHRRHPLLLAVLDLVELVLHAGGELDVEDVGEGVDQQIGHQEAQLGRSQAARLVLDDVLLVEDRRHDAGVGRRPADALLLQLLDQRRLAEARRRLGEVLLGQQLVQLQRLAFA